MPNGWTRLATETLGSSGNELDTGNDSSFSGDAFANKQYLKIIISTKSNSKLNITFGFGTSGTMETGSNYKRYHQDNAGSWTGESLAALIDPILGYKDSTYAMFELNQIAGKVKCLMGQVIQTDDGTGSSSGIVQIAETIVKVNHTADYLTRVKVNDSVANFAVGSTITVWGADDASSSTAYPFLPNGAIFEESDGTGKHYMWDGTDTWNEIT